MITVRQSLILTHEQPRCCRAYKSSLLSHSQQMCPCVLHHVIVDVRARVRARVIVRVRAGGVREIESVCVCVCPCAFSPTTWLNNACGDVDTAYPDTIMMKRFAILLERSWTQTNTNLFGHQHPQPQIRGINLGDHAEKHIHTVACAV